jgi:hypothetical protein
MMMMRRRRARRRVAKNLLQGSAGYLSSPSDERRLASRGQPPLAAQQELVAAM